MADGTLDEREGFTIKNFIKDNIAFYDPNTKNILKKCSMMLLRKLTIKLKILNLA